MTTVGVGAHLVQAALSVGKGGLNRADELGRDIDRDALIRLVRLAVDRAQDDLRSTDLELETLPAHLLDEDRQLQLPAPENLVRVRRRRRLELDRDVAEDFLLQPLLDMTARDVAALPSRQRRGVSPECHAERGRVEVDPLHRPGIGRIRDSVADGHVRYAGQGHDVAGARFIDVDALDAVGGGKADHGPGQGDGPSRLDRAGRVLGLLADDHDPPTHLDRAIPDPADGHPADVVVC
jgi:hypothetical protein